MKRAALAIVSTVACLVLLLSFKTHGTAAVTTPPAAVATTNNSGSSGTSGNTTRSSGSASSPTGATTTHTGTAANTRYGPVQVRITVKNGTISDVSAVDYPTS